MTIYFQDNANWDLIPAYMHGAVERYVMHGVPPGSFLTAVLSNDLREAFARADDDNTAAMKGWVRFIYMHVPSNAHGTPEMVDAWCERGGVNGRAAA